MENETTLTEEQREDLESLAHELERAIRYYQAMLEAIRKDEYSPKDAIVDWEQLAFTEGLNPMAALEQYALGDEEHAIE